jgi:hypothetical protein
MRDTAFILFLAFLLCAQLACGKRQGDAKLTRSVAPSVASAKADGLDPLGYEYPKARWRLAMFEELDRATIWLGHIAIRHRFSQPDGFRVLSWRPDSPNPDRSVVEALALAEEVARLAANDPNDFERLARQYSEDIVSNADGGSLGGVRASQLQGFDFLDALVTLRPGEVSKAFRTPYGFHILKRYAPPPEQQLAGERIVIGYQGVFGPAGETGRTRAEAERLARKIGVQATQNAREFRALADRYTESAERLQHGDFGVYSTLDPAYLPIEVYRLSRLAVGEVTGPHDSCFGFEILKRVPVAPREAYAMAAIELPFDGSRNGRDASLATARTKAEQVHHELGRSPERFEELQRSHRSERIERWTRGRGDPELTQALDALSFGGIAPKPLLYGNAYVVLKRLDPRALPPEEPRLAEIPLPSEPNYAELLKYNDGAQVADAARSLVRAVERSKLPPAVTRRIAQTLHELAATLEREPYDRSGVRAAIEAALTVLESRLSADDFALFESFARRWAIQQVMPAGSADTR